jgi:arylsulfatase
MKALILLLDTCRADRLSCYGHTRPTTPNIDRVAGEGVRFTNAFASDTPCVPSQANKFTGQAGTRSGIVTNGVLGHTLRPGSDQMQRHFGRAGHRTCAVSTVVDHAPFFYQGWEAYFRPSWHRHMQWIPASEINDAAIPWLRQHAGEDFLLFVHYWDPHTPYQFAPQEIFQRYYGDRDPAQGDDTIERCLQNPMLRMFFQDNDRPHRHIPPGIRDIEWLLAQYDAEITYADRQAGRLFAVLDELGIADETLLIILADHGEQFGEWNGCADHMTVHDSVQRIPLIVRYPGRYRAGLVSDALVLNNDIVPTLLNEAGIAHFQTFDAIDIGPICRCKVSEVRDEVFLTHGLWTAQRAMRTKKWKYVSTLAPEFWELPESALYDLEADPGETTNVIDRYPAVATDLRSHMQDRIEDCLAGRTDPLRVAVERGLPGRSWVREQAVRLGRPIPPELLGP